MNTQLCDILHQYLISESGDGIEKRPVIEQASYHRPYCRLGLWVNFQPSGYSTFPVSVAIFNSPMALVIWISRGQAMVQL
jgi:hypothetical protein